MSEQSVPNPFDSARRVVAINVQLNPEDVIAVWPMRREQAERLLDRHASSIAVQMLTAGKDAVAQIIEQEGI